MFLGKNNGLPVYSSTIQCPDLEDINNDGGQYLVFVTPNGGIRIWTYNKNATQWINLSGNLPASGTYPEAQFSDFNADGMMDHAALGNAAERVTLLLGITGVHLTVLCLNPCFRLNCQFQPAYCCFG